MAGWYEWLSFIRSFYSDKNKRDVTFEYCLQNLPQVSACSLSYMFRSSNQIRRRILPIGRAASYNFFLLPLNRLVSHLTRSTRFLGRIGVVGSGRALWGSIGSWLLNHAVPSVIILGRELAFFSIY